MDECPPILAKGGVSLLLTKEMWRGVWNALA